jgi:predicted DNA-binding transcriptional regulator YafY
VLPPRLRTRLEDISVATVSTVTSSAARVDQGALAVAAAAARGRERLRFGYVDGDGRASERHAEPLRLVHTGRRWYLVAFDIDRDDWRTFRLDRVSSPRATGMRSARRPEPDPIELVERGVAIDVYTHRGTIQLDTTVDNARRVIATTVGALEAIDADRCRLVIGADDITWLARFLLGLPWNFVVEGPEELKMELGRIGANLVAGYASSSSSSASSSSVAVPVSETIRNASVGK